jgi:divalent metal cation (Fe/Co/Zn/Cd) transporter
MTNTVPVQTVDGDRARLVRRGIRLSYATIGYNTLEAIGSLVAGFLAGSVALVGFGIDSVIEVTASLAAQWRLRTDWNHAGRDRAELLTLRIVGWCFIALAGYVLLDASKTLLDRQPPERSLFGVLVLSLSVIVMPLLARSKKRVARELRSGALESEATQTSLCAYLSVIGLVGVALNATLGWWWADPVAALVMVPIIAREGVEGIRAESSPDACC